jgi:methylated-DNA-[protein]-cysteine S-methyltransferase
MDTPLGPIVWAERDGTLRALEFADRARGLRARLAKHAGKDATFVNAPARGPIADRLRAYFAGDVASLARIRVEADGTPFQRRVWAALRRIPAGRTASYREIAEAVGKPTAVRALGAANGANPIAVVVPCHRVIGADGSLVGYGGGLARKKWLLRHEGARE